MRELLERIEEQLSGLDFKNLIVLYVMTFFLVGGGAYYFFFDSLLQEYENNKATIAKLERKLRKNDPKVLERKIVQLKKEILFLKQKIEDLRLVSLSLRQKLEKKRYAALTQKSFSKFLDIMLQKSLKKNIAVHEVTISDRHRQLVGRLYEVKRVDLLFEGSFLPIVTFIRQTEAMPYLFNIDELNLTRGENRIEGRAVFHFYGAQR